MAGEIGVKVEIVDKLKGKSKPDLELAVAILDSMALYVGIPEGSGGEDGKLTNVQLAYLHSNGSPVNNIPARPFIEPAIEQEEVMSKMAAMFGQAFEAAIEGDAGAAEIALAKAGIYGRNAVREYMGTGALQENAEITITGGWMRNKVSGKPVYVHGKGYNNPLIRTGALRDSVTYVIAKGGDK